MAALYNLASSSIGIALHLQIMKLPIHYDTQLALLFCASVSITQAHTIYIDVDFNSSDIDSSLINPDFDAA
jgi:hypothetical protein